MGRLLPLLLLSALAGAAPDARAEFRRRAAALERGDAVARFELALFCEAHGLRKEARRAHEAVLALDPRHRASRRALGYRRVEGGWEPSEARVRELRARAGTGPAPERLRAVALLAERPGAPGVLEALAARSLLDASGEVRRAAVEAMKGGGDRACAALLPGLGSASPTLRLRAIEALGLLGDAAAVPALRLRYRLAGGSAQGAWIGQTRQAAFVQDFDVEVA